MLINVIGNIINLTEEAYTMGLEQYGHTKNERIKVLRRYFVSLLNRVNIHIIYE